MEKSAKSETRFSYPKGGYDKLKKTMREQNRLDERAGGEVLTFESWTCFKQMMDSATNECIPKCGTRRGISSKQRKPVWWNEKTLAKTKKKRKAYQDTCILEKAETILNMQKLARNQAKGASCPKATPTGLRSLSLGRLNRIERRYFMHTLRTK